jgi:hypothetical protein
MEVSAMIDKLTRILVPLCPPVTIDLAGGLLLGQRSDGPRTVPDLICLRGFKMPVRWVWRGGSAFISV